MHGHSATFWREFDGVPQKVPDDLLQTYGIADDEWEIGAEVEL